MLKLITAPTGEPLDLTTTKLQLRVDYTDDDTLINGLITAARSYVETITNRGLLTQTWEYWFDQFPATPFALLYGGAQNIYGVRREVLFPNLPVSQGYIELPIGPLRSVTYVNYYDVNNSVATFTSSNYFVDDVSEPSRIVLANNASWPSPSAGLRQVNAGVVRFDVGYGLSGTVPQPIIQAMLMLIGHWYQNREQVVAGMSQVASVPFGVDEILAPYRIWNVG